LLIEFGWINSNCYLIADIGVDTEGRSFCNCKNPSMQTKFTVTQKIRKENRKKCGRRKPVIGVMERSNVANSLMGPPPSRSLRVVFTASKIRHSHTHSQKTKTLQILSLSLSLTKAAEEERQ